ncbi:MAG: DUF4249 domain-containing protein [Bacteroidales bacterium]|nr:DUF4249 domain-containing protein [Bacteroidales bacterium]
MYYYHKIIILFAILISLASCTKEIDIELPDETPKIVVNSFFTDNSRIKVHLSKSIGVLENTFPECTDATVIISENNIIIDTMYMESGYYCSHITAEQNKKYSLKVIVPDIDTAFCEDIIPEKTILQSVVYTDSVLINQDGNIINEIRLDFQDFTGPDFYEIELAGIDTARNDNIPVSSQNQNVPIWFDKNSDPVITSTGLLDYNPRTLIFTDKLFDGEHCSVRVYFYTQWYRDYNLKIILRSVSESYYKYREKQFAYLFSLDHDIFSGMSEPVKLYSNITGGYGIFAGYSSDEKVITVPINQ